MAAPTEAAAYEGESVPVPPKLHEQRPAPSPPSTGGQHLQAAGHRALQSAVKDGGYETTTGSSPSSAAYGGSGNSYDGKGAQDKVIS